MYVHQRFKGLLSTSQTVGSLQKNTWIENVFIITAKMFVFPRHYILKTKSLFVLPWERQTWSWLSPWPRWRISAWSLPLLCRRNSIPYENKQLKMKIHRSKILTFMYIILKRCIGQYTYKLGLNLIPHQSHPFENSSILWKLRNQWNCEFYWDNLTEIIM